MQVILERATVFAGEVVRGKVFIHNATEPVNYNEVFVEVGADRCRTDAIDISSAGVQQQRKHGLQPTAASARSWRALQTPLFNR
jgi:hypothetical protein